MERVGPTRRSAPACSDFTVSNFASCVQDNCEESLIVTLAALWTGDRCGYGTQEAVVRQVFC